MNDEHPNIINRDWRLRAITTLAEDFNSPFTGKLHKAGTPVETIGFAKYNNQLAQIQVPDPTAIYISLANRASVHVMKSLQKLETEMVVLDDGKLAVPSKLDSSLFDVFENMIACIIFSYTAIEAFANDALPKDIRFEKMRGDKKYTEVYSKEQVERHVNLETKLHEILPGIFSTTSPKGTKIWEDYIWLKDLRDRFIHLKPSDWGNSSPEGAEDYVWSHLLINKDKVIKASLISLSIIAHYYPPNKPRWLSKITKKMISHN